MPWIALVALLAQLGLDSEPPIVRATLVGSDDAALAELIAGDIGAPYEAALVAERLRDLARMSELEAASVEVTFDAAGAAVVYRVRLRPRVERIVWTGSARRVGKRLAPTLLRQTGSSGEQRQYSAAAERLADSLRNEGYSGVRVDARLTPSGAGLELAVEAAAGAKMRVRDISWTGFEAVAGGAADWAKAADLEPGDRLRPAVLVDAAERVRDALRRAGYFDAAVVATASPDEALTDVEFRAEPGPHYELQTVDPEVLEIVVDELGDRRVDDLFLRRLEARVRRKLQRDDHPQPKVAVQVRQPPETAPRLVVDLDPGPQAKLADVLFDGAVAISAERLRAVMETQPSSWWHHGKLVEDALARDLAAIRALYLARGHLQVVVGPTAVELLPDDTFALRIAIHEGPVTTVTEIELRGAPPELASELAADVGFHVGDPFDEAAVGEAAVRIRSHLDRLGHRDAVVQDLPPIFADDGRSAAVAFQVEAGPTTTVGRLLIKGATRTRPDIVRRIAGLESGQPLSVERLISAKQNLTKTGLFGGVEVEAIGPRGEASRDVLLRIEEGRNLSVSYGIGFEYDSEADSEWNPRGSIAIYQRNLFGTQRLLGAEARLSSRETRWGITYREPYLFGYELPLSISLFQGREERPGPNLTVEREGLNFETRHRLNRVVSGHLRLAYDVADITEAPAVAIPSGSEEIVASIEPTLVADLRDDPFDPSTGSFFSVSLEWGFPLVDADARFLKWFGQGSLYHSIGPITFAGSVRGGTIDPLGASTGLADNLAIPLVERFFAGGRSSHRAFGLDALGIRGQTVLLETHSDGTTEWVPVGGNALLLASIEARFPLIGDVDGAAFVDAGNVWATPSEFDAGDIRVGAGLGIRYRTPIGPLRLDWAWKLDRQEGEDPTEISFSVGYPF